MIEVKNIIKVFEIGDSKIYALNDVSFRVEKGEFLAITGRSGSGKSTLLYQMGLLDYPTSGTVFLDGRDVSKDSENKRTVMRLEELGYVFQDYALLPSLTTLENVTLPLLMQGYGRVSAAAKAQKALERVGVADRTANLPSQLSGGQQQRVSIARAIGHDPKIVFADEPTANLDSETSRMVLDAFLDLHKQGQTIIMVTHEKEYAALADREIILSDGKIVEDTRRRKEKHF